MAPKSKHFVSNRMQIRMVSMLLLVRKEAEESISEFVRRRNRRAGTVCNAVGRWSHTWACRVCGWDAHVRRDTGKLLWPTKLLMLRDHHWLQQQRAKHAPTFSIRPRAWTALAGRTGTRAASGHVAVRWEDGVIEATEIADKARIEKGLRRALKCFSPH